MSTGDGGTRPMPRVPEAGEQRSTYQTHEELPTTVIGRVGPPSTTTGSEQRASPRAGIPVAGRGLRVIEMVSGLLGGGVLLAGLVLLVLQFAAPSLVTAGRGPGWTAVAVHLGVGVAAEILRAFRGRLRIPLRWTVAGLVILATIGVLLLIWW